MTLIVMQNFTFIALISKMMAQNIVKFVPSVTEKVWHFY